MTTIVVVDASVLVKRLLAEPDSEAVRTWFNTNEGARFLGPTLLFSEVGRILQKNLPKADTAKLRGLHERLMAGVTLVPPEGRIWQSIHGLTFYDAHYVQLARDVGAVLATTDKAMRAAAREYKVSLADF